MKITILNGDPNFKSSQFSKNIGDVVAKMGQKNAITTYNLAEMDLHFCTGCWSCWWKTPGLCAIKDDADAIFRSAINCDLLVFASPLIAGFTSAELKKITDRLIVLLHPYIQLIDGECHHRKRYPKYPDLGVLLAKEPDTDDEDLSIVRDVYDRLAINFHSKVAMFMYLDNEQQNN